MVLSGNPLTVNMLKNKPVLKLSLPVYGPLSLASRPLMDCSNEDVVAAVAVFIMDLVGGIDL